MALFVVLFELNWMRCCRFWFRLDALTDEVDEADDEDEDDDDEEDSGEEADGGDIKSDGGDEDVLGVSFIKIKLFVCVACHEDSLLLLLLVLLVLNWLWWEDFSPGKPELLLWLLWNVSKTETDEESLALPLLLEALVFDKLLLLLLLRLLVSTGAVSLLELKLAIFDDDDDDGDSFSNWYKKSIGLEGYYK